MKNDKNDNGPAQITPEGSLVHLTIEQLQPSPHNPRRLFDPEPLAALRESIRQHGVLVPLTVYKLPGQDKYAIVDGERRYRCCADLAKDDIEVRIPANVVGSSSTRCFSFVYVQHSPVPAAVGVDAYRNSSKVNYRSIGS